MNFCAHFVAHLSMVWPCICSRILKSLHNLKIQCHYQDSNCSGRRGNNKGPNLQLTHLQVLVGSTEVNHGACRANKDWNTDIIPTDNLDRVLRSELN